MLDVKIKHEMIYIIYKQEKTNILIKGGGVVVIFETYWAFLQKCN